jgi:NADPH:quinone reductase-like Zn-dependent oxidoreductase
MKAARIHSFGGPEVVEIGDAAAQEPQAREVLVGVEAASVNPLDLKIVAGYMKEFFPVEFPYRASLENIMSKKLITGEHHEQET